jgi:hydroxyethylthiazole kinase-like uncharacterized protein yjeF
MPTIIEKVPPLPHRPEHGHKGMFGRVLVVGGSRDMPGAPVLAGLAALRAGSGLVQVATLRKNLPMALAVCPELIGLGLEGFRPRVLVEAAKLASAIVVGPGMGTSPIANRWLRDVMSVEVATVVDADALNLIAARGAFPSVREGRCVLTPHPGEMARLMSAMGLGEIVPDDDVGRIEIAVKLAQLTKQVVALKGKRTVVASSEAKVFVNHTGDSSLSKAGTGDVLAGLIASLIGQGMTVFDAAAAGVHVHGLAGERAAKRLGRRSVLASDVAEELAGVMSGL